MITPWERIRSALRKVPSALRRWESSINGWEKETKWLWNINFFVPYIVLYGIKLPLDAINENFLHITGQDAAYSYFFAISYVAFGGILLANAILFFKAKKHRIWFVILLFLNVFSFFLLGEISISLGFDNWFAWAHLSETMHYYDALLLD